MLATPFAAERRPLGGAESIACSGKDAQPGRSDDARYPRPGVRTIIAWALLATLALVACEGSQTATPSPVATDVAVPPSPSLEPAGDGTATGVGEQRGPWRLVTLGDAYTAGYSTDLPRRDSWPAQVVESLKRAEVPVNFFNLAARGVSSVEVLEDQLEQVGPYQPDVVTVQVGINDLVYHETEEGYRQNLASILDGLLELLPPEQIFAITTPRDARDAEGDDRDAARADIDQLNAVLADVAAERDIEVIDIGPVNRLGDDDVSMSERDGVYIYPTAKQYAGWAEVIGPHIRAALSAIEP
jgi:lysophospholipase L1-like esterase